jgi:DNA-directed RNA polymerase subunit RPC12/RpoP
MMKSEALRCDYCGGFINPATYKCPYCGTQYIKPREDFRRPLDVKMVAVTAPTEVIGVRRYIDMYDYKMMQDIGVPIEQEVRRDMANQIAEAIADKIEIYEDFDLDSRRKSYMAKLRVVKPDFRF